MTDGTYTGIYCEGLASGSTVSGNMIENYATGIECTESITDILNNGLIQSGSMLGTGTGISIENGSNVLIHGNDVENYAIGLSSESGSGNPPSTLLIQQNRFIDNSDMGMHFRSTNIGYHTGPNVTANENDIHDNTNYNLYVGQYQNPAMTTLNVEDNWWGTTDSVVIDSLIFDYFDDTTSAVADFIPYRDGPIVPGSPSIATSPTTISVDLFPESQTIVQLYIQNSSAANVLNYSIEEGVGDLTSASFQRNSGYPLVAHRDNRHVMLSPTAEVSWLNVNPPTGTVAPMGAALIDVTLNSSGLPDGRYTSYLVISSNDPDSNPLVVPVVMNVDHVFVLSPAQLDTLYPGAVCEITWTVYEAAQADHVDILYTTDGGSSFSPIALGEPNDFSYNWCVPRVDSDSCSVTIIAHYSGGGSEEGTSLGWFTILDKTSDVEEHDQTPGTARLKQNYPNPFNPTTTIGFDLPRAQHVQLNIYSVKGEFVFALLNKNMTKGYQEVTWNARDYRGRTVASGIYFYRLITGDYVETKKMILLR
jgi:hypothetical protein